MRFNIIINQRQCVRHGLNSNQAALMALLCEVGSWATERVIGGKMYWHVSRNKVISEIPLFYSKADTVYRAYKFLAAQGMIEYVQEARQDFVRLTSKGKGWNKVGNKSEFGNESEKLGNSSELQVLPNPTVEQEVSRDNSEMNPTYNIINTTNDNIYANSAIAFLEKNAPVQYESVLMKYKSKISDFQAFATFYDCKVVEESLEWEIRILLARMERMASTWTANAAKDGLKQQHNTSAEVPGPRRNVFKG